MRILATSEVAEWVRDDLLNPARERPIVAITTRPRDGGTWINPNRLDEAVGGHADVVVLETGDATWELADALPPRLDCYGGAIRTWWPGLHARSNPYDHRLYFVHSHDESVVVLDEIVAAVRERAPRAPESPPPVVEGRVTAIRGGHVEIEAEGVSGPLRFADVPLLDLAICLEVGMSLRVRQVKATGDGSAEFSVQGLLPTPWERAGIDLSVGDVVVGRVQNVVDYGAFIDILPKVAGLAHKSEIDWTFVEDVSDFVKPGDLVRVMVMTIDPAERRMELSIKRAQTAAAGPLPSLVPGGKAFSWGDALPRASAVAGSGEAAGKAPDLSRELDELAGDRARLAEQNKDLREQNQELRKKLRSLEDRFAMLERRVALEADPLADERAFVRAVRLTHARMLDEDDRLRRPLLRMRVGPRFLDSIRALEGADIEKVLEVCAQVAADFAHEIAAREVHQLKAGRSGQPRLRSSDDAQAWRCALQVKSPSARRLHWWRIPGVSGATIEFAGADVHDEFGIAE
jgi:exosome complex RNA-binding protein Csl4